MSNPPAPPAQGSVEAISETAFRAGDKYTGATIVIYPSVLNPTHIQEQDYSALRSYLAPLCVILIPDSLTPYAGRNSSEKEYSFKMLNFHDRVDIQAISMVTQQYARQTNGFKLTAANISRLTHQLVTLR